MSQELKKLSKRDDSQEKPFPIPTKSATDNKLLRDIRIYLYVTLWIAGLTGCLVFGIFLKLVTTR